MCKKNTNLWYFSFEYSLEKPEKSERYKQEILLRKNTINLRLQVGWGFAVGKEC